MVGVVDPGGKLEVTGGGGSGSSVDIIDGVNPAIAATVFDRPNSNPIAVELVDINGDPLAGSAVSIADGADVTLGAIADAEVLDNNPGTISAKLRGINDRAGQIKLDTSSLAGTIDPGFPPRLRVNPIVGQSGVDSGAGATTSKTQRVILANDSTLPPAVDNVFGPITFTPGSGGDITVPTPGGGVVTVFIGTGATGLIGILEQFTVGGPFFSATFTNNAVGITNPIQNFLWFQDHIGANFGTNFSIYVNARGINIKIVNNISGGSAAISAVFKPNGSSELTPTILLGSQSGLGADVDAQNRLNVSLMAPTGWNPWQNLLQADGIANPGPSVGSLIFGVIGLLFNGATLDRARGDTTSGAWSNIKGWFGSLAPTVGSKVSANSIPVVVASDQSVIPVSVASIPLPSGAATEATLATVATNTGAIETTLTNGNQLANIFDSTSGATATVKPASTLPVATDKALVVTARDPISINDIVASSGTFGALNASLQIQTGSGTAGVGFTLQLGTLFGTILFQQSSDGIVYSNVTVVRHSDLLQAGSFSYTGFNPTTVFTVLLGNASKFVKVTVNAYTSGSAIAILQATPIISPFSISPSLSLAGQISALTNILVGGKDSGGLSRALLTDTLGRLLSQSLGLVSDTRESYINGDSQPASLTSDGRMRVAVSRDEDYLEFFYSDNLLVNTPSFTDSKNPYKLDNNPWGN